MAGLETKDGQVTHIDLGGFNKLRWTGRGFMLYNRNDMYVGESINLYGEYNAAEAALLKRMVNPASIVVEVGANMGSHTIPLSRWAGKVHAFEPQRLMYQVLTANAALNHCTNVYTYQCALGAREGFVPIPRVPPDRTNNFGALGVLGKKELDAIAHEHVPCYALDEVCEQRNINPNLVKIDVEGMEIEVLTGAEKVIRRQRPLLYVENDRESSGEALIKVVRGLGYRLYWHRPELGPKWPGVVSQNMVCVPKEMNTQPYTEGLEPVTGYTPLAPAG